MKKILMFIAAVAIAVSASAQKTTVTANKALDNIYVGFAAGAETKASKQKLGSFASFGPTATLIVGKNFDPIFGLRAEGVVRFNVHGSNPRECKWVQTRVLGTNATAGKFVNGLDVNLLGTFNLSNAIAGYKGQPRTLEFIALYGFGWSHKFGGGHVNAINSKAGLDVAFNFGAKKQWQAFVEPSINFFDLNSFKYNIDNSFVQVTAGLVYKFNNSWGTHNFKLAELRDQAEIDALNAQINELRNRKPEVITKEVVKEVPVGKEVRVEDLVFVTFAQGKYNLTNEAKAALDKVAEGAHVQIVGTASPEGSKELNDRLSQNRANAVADYLKGRGVVVDEAIGKGVQGTTSNRLAIVYVK